MWQLDWDDAFNNFVNVENPNALIEKWRGKILVLHRKFFLNRSGKFGYPIW